MFRTARGDDRLEMKIFILTVAALLVIGIALHILCSVFSDVVWMFKLFAEVGDLLKSFCLDLLGDLRIGNRKNKIDQTHKNNQPELRK